MNSMRKFPSVVIIVLDVSQIATSPIALAWASRATPIIVFNVAPLLATSSLKKSFRSSHLLFAFKYVVTLGDLAAVCIIPIIGGSNAI